MKVQPNSREEGIITALASGLRAYRGFHDGVKIGLGILSNLDQSELFSRQSTDLIRGDSLDHID